MNKKILIVTASKRRYYETIRRLERDTPEFDYKVVETYDAAERELKKGSYDGVFFTGICLKKQDDLEAIDPENGLNLLRKVKERGLKSIVLSEERFLESIRPLNPELVLKKTSLPEDYIKGLKNLFK